MIVVNLCCVCTPAGAFDGKIPGVEISHGFCRRHYLEQLVLAHVATKRELAELERLRTKEKNEPMQLTYTVQEGTRIVYEGPIEKNAQAQFEKSTAEFQAQRVEYKVFRNDRIKFRGDAGRAAMRSFYDGCETLRSRGHRTDTVRLEVNDSQLGLVAYTVRPFEERLLGGDAQHSRTGSQVGGP